MIAGLNSALSGMQAGGRLLGASAHNIANAFTEDFKRTEAIPEVSASGGVSVRLEQDNRPGPIFFDPDDPTTPREGSNVDLAEEIVGSLEAAYLFEANAASFTIQDHALGSILDILE